MTYRERLQHWAVVRLLPGMQRVVVERFRNRFSFGDAARTDADGHAQALRQLFPDAAFIVVFDPVGDRFEDLEN